MSAVAGGVIVRIGRRLLRGGSVARAAAAGGESEQGEQGERGERGGVRALHRGHLVMVPRRTPRGTCAGRGACGRRPVTSSPRGRGPRGGRSVARPGGFEPPTF
uniref:Uncharacterized protein n=1 Tax=Eiseniibacteriota bacterium TaxID=2212470 RepID=A0A832I5Q1_UNCEI